MHDDKVVLYCLHWNYSKVRPLNSFSFWTSLASRTETSQIKYRDSCLKTYGDQSFSSETPIKLAKTAIAIEGPWIALCCYPLLRKFLHRCFKAAEILRAPYLYCISTRLLWIDMISIIMMIINIIIEYYSKYYTTIAIVFFVRLAIKYLSDTNGFNLLLVCRTPV